MKFSENKENMFFKKNKQHFRVFLIIELNPIQRTNFQVKFSGNDLMEQ